MIHKQADVVKACVEAKEEKLVLTEFYSSKESRYHKGTFRTSCGNDIYGFPLCVDGEIASRKQQTRERCFSWQSSNK